MLIDRKSAILFLFAFFFVIATMFVIAYNFYYDHVQQEQLQSEQFQNNLIKH